MDVLREQVIYSLRLYIIGVFVMYMYSIVVQP